MEVQVNTGLFDVPWVVESLRDEQVVQRFDPVPYRQRGSALEVGLAADVGGEYGLRCALCECFYFVGAQLVGEFGLQDGISAGRAAAQVRIGNRCEIEAQFCQQRFDGVFLFQSVLQRAGRMKRYAFHV